MYFKLIREVRTEVAQLKETIQQMQQQMQMFLTGMQTLESKSNKRLERLEMRNSQELKRRRPRGSTPTPSETGFSDTDSTCGFNRN